MKRLALIVAALALSACERHHALPLQPSLSTSPVTREAVIPCTGQSNALGAGMMPDEFDAVNGVSIDNKRQGPCYVAAAELVKTVGPVRVFQCSVGGSPMDKWKPGGDLLEGCITYVRSHLGPNQYVAGVLFDQGESEASGAYGVNYPWAYNFTQMVNRWRQVFPNVPVIYAQLGPNTCDPATQPEWGYIQQEQASVNLAKVVMVSTAGLDVVGEHYTANGYIELGRRMAEAYRGME